MRHPTPVTRRDACLLGAGLLALAGIAPVRAQTGAATALPWPMKPVTVVAVFSAGGPVDIVTRIVAKGLSDHFQQQFVVENRVGAAGTVGAASVARAEPDGYTVLGVNSAHTATETLYKNRRYDLAKDFAPVSLIGGSANWLLVNPKVHDFKSVAELLAWASAHPGKLSYASGGSGGLTHLSAELLKARAGVDILHVPYKGNAPAFTDLIAGRVDMIFDQPVSSEAFVKSGQLRPLAVTSRTRLAAYPDLPTMVEAGVADFEAAVWYGLALRAGTPRAIVSALNAGLAKVLAQYDIRERLQAAGVTPAHSTPEAFAGLMRADTARWREVIERAGITAQ
jgi:tripartite-type tricarboxylate transporter receptor subunit TctC